MKFQVTFKDPDAMSIHLAEVVKSSLAMKTKDLTDHQLELLEEDELKLFEEFTKPWIKWGEYVTVEFDTEAGTATVVPVG